MLRDALYLARLDARFLLTRRETIIWTFVMPVVFFYFIGTITGNSFHSATARDNIVVRVAPGAGFLADQFIDRLNQRNYRVIRLAPTDPPENEVRQIEIPGGFTDLLLAGHPVKLRFDRIGEDSDVEYDRVRLSAVIYTLVSDLSLAGPNATPERFANAAAAPHIFTLDVHAAGHRADIPSGFEQSVPGTMVMFTLLVLFTSGAVTITIERRIGVLRRLASTPMSRGAVVVGKFGARMTVGAIQIAFAMLAGTLLFRVKWGPNLPVLLLVLLAYGALAAALAMLLGNACETEGQVIGLGVVLSNVLAGLGGCWWPIELTPLWAQKMALFLPTGLTMDALHKLVNFGAPALSVAPHFCVLAAAAGLALYLLSRRFRFQ